MFQKSKGKMQYKSSGSSSRTASIDRALNEIGQPVQFSSQLPRMAIDKFSHLLGSGGFGAVYRGNLLGLLVAAKVLNGSQTGKFRIHF